MVFARTAAMAFNRWADRGIDALNPRTKNREIPSGKLASGTVLAFVVVNCLAFIITTYFINPICFYLSFVALTVVLGYSYTKRFTSLCHLVLGLGLSLAPIGSWLAITGRFETLPIIFSFAVFTWVSGFDIIYAMQDQQFDQKNDLHSIPARLGSEKALIVSRLLHMTSALLLFVAGISGNFGVFYFTGCVIFSLLLIHQHRLVKADDLSKVDLAFFTTNGLAGSVFSIFVLIDLFS